MGIFFAIVREESSSSDLRGELELISKEEQGRLPTYLDSRTVFWNRMAVTGLTKASTYEIDLVVVKVDEQKNRLVPPFRASDQWRTCDSLNRESGDLLQTLTAHDEAANSNGMIHAPVPHSLPHSSNGHLSFHSALSSSLSPSCS